MTENVYDMIVVGAGYGGVTAAAKLASQGYRILIADKNKSAGGKAMRIQKDGTAYEMWPVAGGPSKPSRFDDLIDLIGLDSNQIIRPKDAANFIYMAPDGTQRHVEFPATSPFSKIVSIGKDFYNLGESSFNGLIKIENSPQIIKH